uniref:Chloride channel protein n=1 Tax=Meloidogyne javanica TaxID=6303 RepID=A0A915MQ33_MELJA
FTFRETLGDFIANCTMSLHNVSSSMGCSAKIIQRWTIDNWEREGPTDRSTALDGSMDATIFMPNVFPALIGYLFVNMVVMFPAGIRGVDGPQIYPGLYAVVGAAAYTGAVTHSLSIAVIVCETTGQLSPLLPVLVALMVANAVSSFLQPSIYESIINIRKYPHLAELPPSRISVHTLKVEQIMVRDVVFITKLTSYKELRELLLATPHLRSYPLVTDEGERDVLFGLKKEKILLGSVSRKYLHFLLTDRLGPDPSLLLHRSRRRKGRPTTTTNMENTGENINLNNKRLDSISRRNVEAMRLLPGAMPPKMSKLDGVRSSRNRSALLRQPIDLDDELAIDAAPFQLVIGTSLYKVHTLFSLLGLNHAYVTHRGRLVGVVALREVKIRLNLDVRR